MREILLCLDVSSIHSFFAPIFHIAGQKGNKTAEYQTFYLQRWLGAQPRVDLGRTYLQVQEPEDCFAFLRRTIFSANLLETNINLWQTIGQADMTVTTVPVS